MTIVTQTPNTLRRPGAYSEFDFTSGAQALVPLTLRAAIIGEMSAAATAVLETPVQVFNENDGDAKAGVGSIAAIMLRAAFAQARLSGASPEIWLCPIAEAGGGTKAIETITVTGPATASGNIVFTIAGRTITVGVNNGDAQNTIATAIKVALNALATTIPIVATVAANVVSCTATTKGVNGNDVFYALSTTPLPLGVTVVFAQTVAGLGAATITNACNALYDKSYDAVCISNHTAGTDVPILLAQALTAWGFNQKSYRFFFLADNASLGAAQTLQAAANDYRVVVTSCAQTGSLPGELAVVTAIAEFSRTAPNANLDGEPVYVFQPPPPSAYTAAQVESALSGGCTPLTTQGAGMKIERLVTSQISYNSAPFEPVRDIAYPRTAAYLAKQVEINFASKFKQATADNDFLLRVRDMVIGVQRAMETLRYLRDVDTFLPQIQAEYALLPAGRVNISDPFRVAGPVHQAVAVHTMYL